MVANKVKRNRSARHSNKAGGVQLEIDAYGKLRKVGGTAEEEEAKRKREAAKRGHVGYYRKVRPHTAELPLSIVACSSHCAKCVARVTPEQQISILKEG